MFQLFAFGKVILYQFKNNFEGVGTYGFFCWE